MSQSVVSDRVNRRIIEVVAQHPNGISFNDFHRETKDDFARQTLAEHLRILVFEGTLAKRKVGKQRVLYVSTNLAKRLQKVTSSIGDNLERFEALLMLFEADYRKGWRSVEETVSCVLRYHRAFINYTSLQAVWEAREFPGHAKDAISFTVFDATTQTFNNLYSVFRKDGSFGKAFLAEMEKDRREILQSDKCGIRTSIEEIDDPEVKARLIRLTTPSTTSLAK